MRTVRIYRIEDIKGKGMYYSSRSDEVTLPNASCKHPTPENDERLCDDGYLDRKTSKHRFGFSSKRQLRSWLKKEHLKSLHEAGFVVSIYILCHVRML